MKKHRFVGFLLVLVAFSLFLSGCDSLLGNESNVIRYTDAMESASGKWQLSGDENTYFIFDGNKNAMTVCYYEDNELKYSGNFRATCNSAADALTPLCFIITCSDKSNEDWLNCYAENLDQGFTQFSIMCVEENLGLTDGTVYTHIYRISELPYKLGTYVLEDQEYQSYSKPIFDDGTYRIPEGTYVTEDGQSFCVIPLMNRSYMLFRYINGDTIVEGLFNIAEDRKTIYLYIEHDIYQKIRNADKNAYDTTFSMYYPPDFYLRGDFDTNANSLVINELYHHDYSPTEIDDEVWAFGTYTKQ